MKIFEFISGKYIPVFDWGGYGANMRYACFPISEFQSLDFEKEVKERLIGGPVNLGIFQVQVVDNEVYVYVLHKTYEFAKPGDPLVMDTTIKLASTKTWRDRAIEDPIFW